MSLPVVVALLASAAPVRAEVAPNGPVVGAEFHLGSLLWINDYSTTLEEPNRVAEFDFERSTRNLSYGGALRFGWKLAPSHPIGVAAHAVVSYAGSRTEPLLYDTGANTYEFPARARWFTARPGAELLLWDILAVNAGAGYAFIHRWKSPPESGRGTDSYVLAFGARLRIPPRALVVGYVSFGHEMLGLNPITAFWEGRWTIATYSYMGVGLEFDGVVPKGSQ